MAENKKAFVLYCDLIHTVRKMPKEKIAELFMTILSYVNDEYPVVDDLIVDLVFEPIKHQLKRDLNKWEDFRQKQSKNGKMGGRPKNPNNPSLLTESQKSLTATATDTVTGKVIGIEINSKQAEVFEYLRFSTQKNITDVQLHFEARELLKTYEGKEIKNLRALCTSWANNIKPVNDGTKKLVL